jgi:hypothetical protein
MWLEEELYKVCPRITLEVINQFKKQKIISPIWEVDERV